MRKSFLFLADGFEEVEALGVVDVFPEEFRHWLCADPRIGPLFEEMHADLFRADYWRALQNRIREGHVEDVYAYRRRQRFSVRFV